MATKWTFSNRVSNRRMRDEEMATGSIDPTGEAPYTQSRAALRDRYGSRQIDASAPHSPRDTMQGASPVGVSGGRTASSTWNTFFRPTLAPVGPTDAKAMADLSTGSSLFDPSVPFTAATPTAMFNTAKAEHEAWFDRTGNQLPTSQPRRVGDHFMSRFGSGTVGAGFEDVSRKLKMLGMADDEFDF